MNEKIENTFVFVLGREQKIALEELKSVLSAFYFSRQSACDIYRITGNLVFAKLTNFDRKAPTLQSESRQGFVGKEKELINRLGGTIKIYKLEGGIDKDIAAQIVSLFRIHKFGSEGKINFGISYFGKGFSRQNINSIALAAKKQLKSDFSLRYVESRDSSELSSILTLKNNLLTKGIEFGIFEDCIGVLVALNNPEEWSRRDYDKPASDKYSGMTPPKLARMMVNLAVGEIDSCHPELVSGSHNGEMLNQVQHDNNVLVVDPFCGSGNILLEAMMLGYDVVGSDISEKAVRDTEQNISWLKSEILNPKSETNPKLKIFQADVTKDSLIRNLELEIRNYNSFAVVTEPYLGQPKKFKSSYAVTVREYANIKELYINFFKNLSKLATSKSKLVFCIIFPLVETAEGKRFSVFSEIVDELRKLGYTQTRQPLIYGRDYQVVKREIVLLKFQQ